MKEGRPMIYDHPVARTRYQPGRRRFYAAAALTVLLMMLPVSGIEADDEWPAFTEAELSLTTLSDYPNAPAVVLAESGRLFLSWDWTSSYLEVYRRVKILTADGKGFGSISLFSTDYFRMKELRGRTRSADGTITPLPEDAVFEKTFSRYYNRAMTSFAMPGIDVGSIVEYSYRIYFDSIIFPRPWYFQSGLPTLRSELICVIPDILLVKPLKVVTVPDREITEELSSNAWGNIKTFTMENMPPVADEPHRFPFDSLASRVTILPIATTRAVNVGANRSLRARLVGSGLRYMLFGVGPQSILRSWSSAVSLVQGNPEHGYERFRSRSRGVKGKVKELTSSLSNEAEKAVALYHFVRDEIVTEHYFGVTVGDGTAQQTLKKGRGDYAEKAVLLQYMLDNGAGIDATVAWTSPADLIRIDTEHANLGQLQYPLVVAEIDSEQVFLDPSSNLGFGLLKPEIEGMPCLLVDYKKPEWITAPTTPAEKSGRLASLDLQLDRQGRVTGSGKLIVFGHDAWRRLALNLNRQALSEAWMSWLWRSFPGFDMTNVTLKESSELRQIELTWQLHQREDEILGDEASIAPAMPLAFTRTPFTLPGEQRKSPVHLPFCFTDRVVLNLSWSEEWSVDSLPDLRSMSNGAGYISARIVVNEEKRELTATRQLQVSRRDHIGKPEYDELKTLYQTAVDNDAESLVLIKSKGLAQE
jgi:hypothetical protein